MNPSHTQQDDGRESQLAIEFEESAEKPAAEALAQRMYVEKAAACECGHMRLFALSLGIQPLTASEQQHTLNKHSFLRDDLTN